MINKRRKFGLVSHLYEAMPGSSSAVSGFMQTCNHSSMPNIFPGHVCFPRPMPADISPSRLSLSQPSMDLSATLKQGLLTPMLPGYAGGLLNYFPSPCTPPLSTGCSSRIPSVFQPVSSTSVSRLRANSCQPLGRPHVDSPLVAAGESARLRTTSTTPMDRNESSDQPLDLTLRPVLQVAQSEAVLNSALSIPSESAVWTPSSQRKRSRTCVESRPFHKAEYPVKVKSGSSSDEDSSKSANQHRNHEEDKSVVVERVTQTETKVAMNPTPQRRARRRCTSVRRKSFQPGNPSTFPSLPTVSAAIPASLDSKEHRSDSAPPLPPSPGETSSSVQHRTSSSDESSGPAVPHPGDERGQSLLMPSDEHNSSNSSSLGNPVHGKTSRRSLSAHCPVSCDSSGPADPGICNPRMRRYPEMTPSEVKDDAYWQKRVKNNEAARRSRRARKTKETSLREYANQLEKANAQLTAELKLLKDELDQLKSASRCLNSD